MRMFCCLPVPLSFAVTCRIPLASMSKVTSICGTPRGAGGMPSRLKRPRLLFCFAIGRSPCSTTRSTARLVVGSGGEGLHLARRDGRVASMSLVITPPMVSIPRESGVTSSRSTSFTSPVSTPPWMAAPMATTSSGFTRAVGLFAKELFYYFADLRNAGRTTYHDHFVDLGSLQAGILQGLAARLQRALNEASRQGCSNLARVSFFTRCLGTPSTAVM